MPYENSRIYLAISPIEMFGPQYKFSFSYSFLLVFYITKQLLSNLSCWHTDHDITYYTRYLVNQPSQKAQIYHWKKDTIGYPKLAHSGGKLMEVNRDIIQ